MNTDYFAFCPRLKGMLDSGYSIDRKGERVSAAGMSTANNLRVIRELILQYGMSQTLEVGLAYGASTLTFLSTLKAVKESGFNHAAIDPLQVTDFGGSGLKVIEEEGYSPNFIHYEDYSSMVLPELVRQNKQYQLIYIDGSHLFEDVFVDFYYGVSLLEAGGLLLFDDSMDKNIRKTIRFIQRNFDSILKPFDLEPFENPGKSLKKRIGNALGVRQLTGFQKVSDPPRKWDTPFKDF